MRVSTFQIRVDGTCLRRAGLRGLGGEVVVLVEGGSSFFFCFLGHLYLPSYRCSKDEDSWTADIYGCLFGRPGRDEGRILLNLPSFVPPGVMFHFEG